MPGTRIRRQHPRFLARLLGLQRRGARARREVPPRGPQHEGLPAHRHGPPDRVRDDEDRRELLPRDDPRLPRRVEPVRRAKRRRSHQGHRGDQDAADPQQHDLPRPRHRRLLPAEGRRPRLLGLQAHPRLRGRRQRFKITPDRDRHQRHPRPARRRARPATRCATWAATSRAPRCSSAARATGRTSATRATAARSSSSGSSPRWAPTCASTIRTSSTGTSSRPRTTTRPPAIHGPLLPQPGGSHEAPGAEGSRRALKGVEALIFAVPHEPYLKLDPTRVVKWAGGPLAVVDCFGILADERSAATSSWAAR